MKWMESTRQSIGQRPKRQKEFTSIRHFSIQTIAQICEKSEDTIRRWIDEGMFSEYFKIKDGYKIPETSQIKCYKRITRNGEKILTIREIIKMNRIKM